MPKFSYDKKSLTGDQLLQAYDDMLNIRKMEENIAKLYSQGLVGGFCHLYIGQESVASGIKLASEQGDSFITSYRAHGFSYICGTSVHKIIAELLGRDTGISRGKGGSMHMFDSKNHFYGGHGIVGAQTSLGAGIAFANKYLNNKKVCYALFGDGAVNQGQLYEAMNMAKLWSLPIVFILENNAYSMGTSLERGCANHLNLEDRGLGFGIEGVTVNGMDLEEVFSTMKAAREYAVEHGPIFINCKTYRYKGHSMSDPAKYRTREEVDSFKSQDCIETVKDIIIKKKFATEEELKNTAKKIKDHVKKSSEAALKDPLPELKELYTDVTVED